MSNLISVALSNTGSGSPAGQFYRGPAAGPE